MTPAPDHPPPKGGLIHGLGEVLGFVVAGAEAVVEACVGWWPELRRNNKPPDENGGEPPPPAAS